MNREEAGNSLVITAHSELGVICKVNAVDELIDKIYNDFESRICGNCEFYEKYNSVCCNGDSPLCSEVVDKNFGCNEFERKTNE